MGKDVYQKLAKHLDNLPGGFPPTESGVELRILRRLFTPEEAELALHLTLIAEEPRVIARRAKLSPEEAARRLEEMAKKGLIYRITSPDKPMRYMALQYIIGIWEFHVNDLDVELIKDTNEYFPTLFDKSWQKGPQLRTIPVGRSITTELEVLSYEQAEELVQAQKKFLVAPCICRREHKMVGKGCDKPMETCLVFGIGADYYERNGLGRIIDKDEALEILKKADEAGLVLQPSNAQKIVNICCCCGCCCQVLKNLKRYPKPASLVSTPFVAAVDTDTCEGCGTCVERCQMEALRLEDDCVVLDPDRCIGCGLCVSTCPTESLTLLRRPEPEQAEVPKNMMKSYIKLARERGKLGTVNMVQMQIKSKVDRLLASK
ncbi:MAG: 4Fe-4S binding protein [Deltaproteobacteria bacterium]|nr:4Fe-4S binding protein [Deltaproteobacteria bacterium]MBW2260296.1 4Fe-4S binding protein [Deltaproteobacteria bacterium]